MLKAISVNNFMKPISETANSQENSGLVLKAYC